MQSSDIDGAFILEYTNDLHLESPTETHPLTIRVAGPFALHEIFVNNNFKSTVVNYCLHWEPKKLAEALNKWASNHNITRPLICVSSLSARDFINPEFHLQQVFKYLDKSIKFKYIVGGPFMEYNDVDAGVMPEYSFHGRSLHIFEQWLKGQIDLDDYVQPGTTKIKPKTNEIIEKPNVPVLYDDYCLMPSDVLTFEARLGCKFNCTFCSFHFRNTKNASDIGEEELTNFFQQAYDKYGIEHFSMADDTCNEDKTKLNILLNATKKLSFKPSIAGFIRFDLLLRNDQAPILDEIGFHGLWFGLESFHEGANKLIRKKMKRQEIFDFCKELQEKYPHWWFNASLIIGIPGEPLEHFLESIKLNAKHRYITNLFPYYLNISNDEGQMNDHVSDITRDPLKYGIRFRGKDYGDSSYGSKISEWYHEHASYTTAVELMHKVNKYNRRKGIYNVSCWSNLVSKAIGMDTDKFKYAGPSEIDDVVKEDFELQHKHIHKYIVKKTKYLQND